MLFSRENGINTNLKNNTEFNDNFYKVFSERIRIFFSSKIAIYLSLCLWAPIKTSKLHKKPSAPKREHLAFKTWKFLNFFHFLCVIFSLLDLDYESGSGYRSIDLIESGYKPDPKHCFTNCVWRLVYSELSRRGSTARTWSRAARRPRMKTSPVRKGLWPSGGSLKPDLWSADGRRGGGVGCGFRVTNYR